MVSDILMFVMAGVVAAFAAAFGLLIWSATGTAVGAGFTRMFTSYGYVTIETTFLCLMLVGAYQVLRIGLQTRGREEEWDFIESDG